MHQNATFVVSYVSRQFPWTVIQKMLKVLVCRTCVVLEGHAGRCVETASSCLSTPFSISRRATIPPAPSRYFSQRDRAADPRAAVSGCAAGKQNTNEQRCRHTLDSFEGSPRRPPRKRVCNSTLVQNYERCEEYWIRE
jgi:hypothetical protein